MNTVTLQYSKESLNKPVLVLDMSKPIYETIVEEVEVVNDGMTVLSERFNPFFKTTFYKVERKTITGFTCVYKTFDYLKAVRFAKYYAKKEKLVYEN